MNRLSTDKRIRVVSGLLEGCSIRSVERMTGVHRDTITRLLVDVGGACGQYMRQDLQHLRCTNLQLDEIWCYVGKKQRHVRPEDDLDRVGDFYTFVALDADSKLVPCYRVGKRDGYNTRRFVSDLASRLDGRVQISTDMFEAYSRAINSRFYGRVDYGRIVKSYEAEPIGPGRYSPPKVTAVAKDSVLGRPDWGSICTSHVERQNLTMRMSMRRFTRLTNAFSKKVENLRAAVALHFHFYNYARIHKTLRITPAMAAGVDSRVWTIEEIVGLADSVA